MPHSEEPREETTPNAIAIIDAAHGFAAKPGPGEADKAAISALVVPALKDLDRSAQAQVAHALMTSARTPEALVDAIADLDASISGPFLASSPALSERILLRLINKGLDQSYAIARRQSLPKSVSAKLRTLVDSRVDRALDLRQKPDRELMRARAPQESADYGLDTDHYHCSKAARAELISLARAEREKAIHTFFSEKLELSMESAAALLGNLKSGNLLNALKVMDFDDDEAWTFYASLPGVAGEDAGLKDRFQTAYRALTRDTGIKLVRKWRLDDIMKQCLDTSGASEDVA